MDYRDIKVIASARTPFAVSVLLVENGREQVWIPRSLVEDEGDSVDDKLADMDSKPFDISVAEWKCDKEGWL